jgi:hypothetical protein
VLVELVDELGSDEAVSADDDNSHVLPFSWELGGSGGVEAEPPGPATAIASRGCQAGP